MSKKQKKQGSNTMPSSPPTDDAVRLLEADLRAERQPLTDLDTEHAWRAFIRFGRRRFDTPNTADADGLLFQYGTYSFGGPTAFTVELIRQFEVVDREGDHDHYVQVSCELNYGLPSPLQALGSYSSWFFHDSGTDLDHWAEEVSSRAAWATISAFKPVSVRVFEEPV
ncbi:hypothetical protein ACH4GK_34705 [Streptomyces rimosus]|uniref:hypothetical protein n=1 Tax=Streptomyces rimosus TaxID=1927 RepID=UPI0018FE0F31|nr:hypothetical protein [Streptomyces rimosus]